MTKMEKSSQWKKSLDVFKIEFSLIVAYWGELIIRPSALSTFDQKI